MLIVRTPVRISFAGGGTDLPAYYQKFGGAVLSTAINKHFYTILQKRSDGKVQVISSDLRVVETWEDIARMGVKGSELEIPLSIMKDLGCAVSVNLFLASEIPPGTGLGSSASVCVNVLKTLTAYLGVPMSKYELAERAFQIARNALGKPVGKQDEYAATFGGINFIQFHSDESVTVEPLDLDSELVRELQANLMLFFTGAAHHSWTILKEQEQSTNKKSGMAVESLHEIRELADTMRGTLKAGNLDEFGALLHKGWEAKKRVSDKISTSHIDEMYGQARVHGATGGKITGAGGGGFLLLYCPPVAQQAVRERLTKMGAREMSFDFDFQGAQVVVDDPFIDADERGGMKWTFEPVRDQLSAATFSPS
jgi:D-glycero-alpha-D-manno-heptose-7-phosphate kinase